MASVWVERHGKNWRVYWREGGRESPRRSQNCGPYRGMADQFAVTKRNELLGKSTGAAAPSPPQSWKGFSADYLKHCEQEKAARTVRNFIRPAMDSFGKAIGDGLPVRDIVPKTVQDWVMGLEPRYNRTTRGMMVKALKAAFNWGVRMEMLSRNPAAPVTAPRSEDGGRALTAKEVEAIIAKAPEPLRRTAVFSLNTGARLSEVFSLRWEMVERQGAAWWCRIPARSRKTRRVVKKDCRFPLNAAARDSMGPERDEGPVFPWPARTVQDQLISVRSEAGCPEATFHWFRHTFATNFLAAGGHIEDLLAAGIWANYDALLRYVHVSDDTLSQRFSALGNCSVPYGCHKKQEGRAKRLTRPS